MQRGTLSLANPRRIPAAAGWHYDGPAPRDWQQSLGYGLAWLVTFAIPWGDMILLPYEIQASRVLTVAAAILWFSLCKRGKLLKPLTGSHWFMLAFAFWAAFSVLWVPEADRGLRRALSYFQLFLAAWLVYQAVTSGSRHRNLMFAYLAGCYVAFSGLTYNVIHDIHLGDGRYSADGFDPNDLSATLTLGIPMAWQAASQPGRGVWIARLYIPCAVIAGLMTASRSGLLTTLICLAYPAVTMSRASYRLVASLIVVMVGSVLLVDTFSNDTSIRRLSTITDQLSARDLNGRVEIWRRGFEAFLERPIAGVGAGGFATAVGASRSRDLAAHNTALGVLVEHGVVGLVLFSAIVIAIFRRAWRYGTSEWRLWAILLTGWVTAANALSWENREVTWLIWGICLAQPFTHSSYRHVHRGAVPARRPHCHA